MSEWISVDDRLPENGKWYLTATLSPMEMGSDRISTMAFLERNVFTGDPLWLAGPGPGDNDEWENVTHWMPLPEPPTTDDGDK